MIRPAGFRGAFFGDATDGNGRDDPGARARISGVLAIPTDWAYANQMHGGVVATVDAAGLAGSVDGLITERPGLPLAIATADCVPIIVEGDRSVAVLHAGWRSVAAGIIEAGLEAMRTLGDIPRRAAIGPSIGPCCYEVGDEVRAAIGGYGAMTTFGTQSVDLWSAAADRLGDVDVHRTDVCTYTDTTYRSYRRNGTEQRQVTVAWVPED
jgi:YfiH family protein